MKNIPYSDVSRALLAIAPGLWEGRAAERQGSTTSVAKTEGGDLTKWQPAMPEGLARTFLTELCRLTSFKVPAPVA